jgi:Flp pilus assembly protein TadB
VSTASDDRPPLRIGTQEREAAYKALEAHLDAGRLDAEEYGERYAHASMARTRPELDALFVDLPEPHPFAAQPQFSQPLYSQPQFGPHPFQQPYDRQSARRGWPAGAARLAAGLLMIVPLLALALFLISGVWVFFLLIPIIGSIAGRRRARGNRRRGSWAGACGPRW